MPLSSMVIQWAAIKAYLIVLRAALLAAVVFAWALPGQLTTGSIEGFIRGANGFRRPVQGFRSPAGPAFGP